MEEQLNYMKGLVYAVNYDRNQKFQQNTQKLRKILSVSQNKQINKVQKYNDIIYIDMIQNPQSINRNRSISKKEKIISRLYKMVFANKPKTK